MPLPSVGALLSTPLHAPRAPALAGAVGAAVGAGFAATFQGISNVLPGTALGALLGVGWTSLQQYMERREGAQATSAEVLELAKYPAVRELLRRAGHGVEDMAALQRLAVRLEADINKMTRNFDAYCRTRGVPESALVAKALRHFYLTHCGERGIVLLSKAKSPFCYLVAARKELQGKLEKALNHEDVRAGIQFRQMDCPYMRVDLALEKLHDAQEFAITVDAHGEMHVHAATTPFEVGAMVQVTRRRCNGKHGVAVPSPDPTAAPASTLHSTGCSARVTRSRRLKSTLAELALAPDSRTLQDLRRIEQDLAANRLRGHALSYYGRRCYSLDIHLEGHWAPGRNRWRLLYQRVSGGYLLIDIDDPHAPRH